MKKAVRPMTKSVRYYDFECPIYGVHFQRVNSKKLY